MTDTTTSHERIKCAPQPEKKTSAAITRAASIVFLAVSCCLAQSCGGAGHDQPGNEPKSVPAAKIASKPGYAGIAAALSGEIADAVEKVMPSVVVVRTEAVDYEIAQDVYRGYLYRVPRRLAGLGSGVIISAEGHVLTCHHVISQAASIEIVTSDSVIYKAELIGSDEASDLAVLKIKTQDPAFIPIEPADSDAVRVGELAIAVGSPFSLASSVTLGIISQKGRSVGMLPFEDFIQTDASINSGNSGGPLVDIHGGLIGINDMIITGSRVSMGNVGIGFAVPSNLAMDVARQIMDSGAFKRPRIGIAMGMLDPDAAGKLVGRPSAVVIAEVMKDSPAAEAGLKDGDVIVEVDGQSVQNMQDVQRIILRHKIDEPVRIYVLRDGKKLSFSLKPVAWEQKERPQRRR